MGLHFKSSFQAGPVLQISGATISATARAKSLIGLTATPLHLSASRLNAEAGSASRLLTVPRCWHVRHLQVSPDPHSGLRLVQDMLSRMPRVQFGAAKSSTSIKNKRNKDHKRIKDQK